MARKIRLGMVGGGAGSFIGGIHRIAARLDGDFELVAGALSSDAARARGSGLTLGLDPTRNYANYLEMAAAESARADGVEVVAIVTPNHMHAGPAKAFLRAGIHVICDKPLTATLDEAEEVASAVRSSARIFVLTHNYTGYPMVRQARRMIADGTIGSLRMVAVEYIQGWLATPIEDTGNKQAGWRTDPARSGPGGALGDIGTHAFNLAEFVTGLSVEEVAADATSMVTGRRLDDNTVMMLRFPNGARGNLWCSQIAIGQQNALMLRVFGDKGSIEWRQEQPELLRVSRLGEPLQTIVRGGEGTDAIASLAGRVPGGHPEGYLEGFAQIYRDTAELIRARTEGREPTNESWLLPDIETGLRGMHFVSAALASSKANGAWTPLLARRA
jgi:predicted dehydrogenase